MQVPQPGSPFRCWGNRGRISTDVRTFFSEQTCILRHGRWPLSGGTFSQDEATTRAFVPSLEFIGAFHEKIGPVYACRTWPRQALGTQASGWFKGKHTQRKRRCFAAECGPDPFEHTRALEGPFFDPNPRARTSALAFIGATRKDRPCFAAERGLDRLGHTSLRMVYWRHTKGTALFCCRTRPRPL